MLKSQTPGWLLAQGFSHNMTQDNLRYLVSRVFLVVASHSNGENLTIDDGMQVGTLDKQQASSKEKEKEKGQTNKKSQQPLQQRHAAGLALTAL